jgi:hypothetical protein
MGIAFYFVSEHQEEELKSFEKPFIFTFVMPDLPAPHLMRGSGI